MGLLGKSFLGISVLLTAAFANVVMADSIRVAVASNFSHTIKKVVADFERQTDHNVVLAFGSTGKHYAQIKHGAPFDLFLAADEKRPRILEQENVAVPGTRFTYARGAIALWSPESGVVDDQGLVLVNGIDGYIAIANPKLAPYGLAAREVLQAKSAWQGLRGKMVRGENIAQAFQFVQTGSAKMGFVAISQLKAAGLYDKGSLWVPDSTIYTPINQQVVLIKESEAGRAFWAFLQSDAVKAMIQSDGYGIP